MAAFTGINRAANKKQMDDYAAIVSLQAKMALEDENLMNQYVQDVELGTIAEVPQFVSALEEEKNIALQNRRALANLKQIMNDSDAQTALTGLQADTNDLIAFNRFFDNFQTYIKGIKYIDATLFRAQWDRYKDKIINETGNTGLRVGADSGEYDEVLDGITNKLKEVGEQLQERITKEQTTESKDIVAVTFNKAKADAFKKYYNELLKANKEDVDKLFMKAMKDVFDLPKELKDNKNLIPITVVDDANTLTTVNAQYKPRNKEFATPNTQRKIQFLLDVYFLFNNIATKANIISRKEEAAIKLSTKDDKEADEKRDELIKEKTIKLSKDFGLPDEYDLKKEYYIPYSRDLLNTAVSAKARGRKSGLEKTATKLKELEDKELAERAAALKELPTGGEEEEPLTEGKGFFTQANKTLAEMKRNEESARNRLERVKSISTGKGMQRVKLSGRGMQMLHNSQEFADIHEAPREKYKNMNPARYAPIGRYLINMAQLKKNRIKITYPSYKLMDEFQPLTSHVISDNLKNTLMGLIESAQNSDSQYLKKMFETDYKDLDNEEREILANIVDITQLNQDDSTRRTAMRKILQGSGLREDIIKRFNVLRGEILAGNNNPKLLTEMKALVLKMQQHQLLTKTDANKLMYDLMMVAN